jgi:hypothetical protein
MLTSKNNIVYQRPQRTYQERLSNQDIKNILKDYIMVEDISKVSTGTHVRYFITDHETKKKKGSEGHPNNERDLSGTCEVLHFFVFSQEPAFFCAKIGRSVALNPSTKLLDPEISPKTLNPKLSP